jgi:hypothetical protein
MWWRVRIACNAETVYCKLTECNFQFIPVRQTKLCSRTQSWNYASLIKHYAMKTYGGGSGGIAPPFFIPVLDVREWSRPGLFTPGEIASCVYWIGGWVGSKPSLDAVWREKSCPCRESNPAASRYTNNLSRLLLYNVIHRITKGILRSVLSLLKYE